MVAAPQIDYLKELATNRWFVLGAYFFAFFPWAIMNNVDFISEKWRTCRRTRELAHIHIASSIFPIIYVAVYAEAQRRDGDDKELGAALAALMFNVFQLLRTIMGILQLNAFVAWCKNAAECMCALLGKDGEEGENDVGVDSRAETSEARSGGAMRELNGLSQFGKIAAWCKLTGKRVAEFVNKCEQHNQQNTSTDEESTEKTVDTHVGWESDGDIEEKIEVNNTVVDNELGGREVTVLPSWKKMRKGLMKGSFEPSSWLRTDRVMLNTVRWSAAYLCGMGGLWGVQKYAARISGELLDTFFSRKMADVRQVLQFVEWNVEVENGSPETISIDRLGNQDTIAELDGEMSTAYGTGFSPFLVQDTYNVDFYTFEFNSLISSYPVSEFKSRRANRESVQVGLAHSVVLAKHLGVEKLRAIRRCYDHHQVPIGRIRQDAFKHLLEQAASRILDDDADIWFMFESTEWQIPLFPYRMQAVSLWDEATNWRVLQASAHQDILISLSHIENEERILDSTLHEVSIFDYCAEWTMERSKGRGLLGVVMETVRTFLAEWIVATGRKPVWEPEIPTRCFELGLGETTVLFEPVFGEFVMFPERRLTWVCQRELQRKVAKTWIEDENLPGNAALIMLFVLCFPCLRMKKVQDGEIGEQESQDGLVEETTSSSRSRDRSLDLSVQVWHAWTALAPQDISLVIRVDLTQCTVSLRLQNSSGDERFRWQDWVDAAMGYMKGCEDSDNDDCGYGREIARADLHKPIVELCPLRVNVDGIEQIVKKTKTARVWLGWPVFDVRICKFEMAQWLAACDINLNGNLKDEETWEAEDEVAQAEREILRTVSAETEELKG